MMHKPPMAMLFPRLSPRLPLEEAPRLCTATAAVLRNGIELPEDAKSRESGNGLLRYNLR
jgi:hypothetical protein